ncbi:hypothetical protein J2Z69_000537 [Paenibacillus shirakamiensis]|uniref:Uncharacterized protein n=1 Tax=Paenibacillus shirakamiensis TaxID=1265935 RepID=A0ABS4JCS7_9BACL|nr:hypothetical protein [Paenibacillus shirakamiensis]MBP1999518.1 hypothetical protein [Paenibacillus shirakamiensis]
MSKTKNEEINEDIEPFEALFLSFSDQMNHFIVKPIFLFVVLLFLFQGLLKIPVLKPYLSSADHYEGDVLPPLNRVLEKSSRH